MMNAQTYQEATRIFDFIDHPRETVAGLLPHTFNDVTISQRQKDGYINATAACKANGKQFNDYSRLNSTQEFLEELSRSIGIPIDLKVRSTGNPVDPKTGHTEITDTPLVLSITTGRNEFRGTWVHPQVAINLAQWISPKFAVAVSKWVYDWMMTGQTPAQGGEGQMERVFAAAFAQMEDRVARLERGLFAQSVAQATLAQPPIRVIQIADGLTLRAFYIDGQVMLMAKGLFPFSLGWVGVPAQLRRLSLSSDRGDFITYTLTDLVGIFRVPLLRLRELANLKPAGNSITILTATGIHRSLKTMEGTVARYLQTNLTQIIDEMSAQAKSYHQQRGNAST